MIFLGLTFAFVSFEIGYWAFKIPGWELILLIILALIGGAIMGRYWKTSLY